ncbi:MAG: uroporphyrinogen-III C-methyltransferase [Candidatus Puniceispirillales bacterium]
MTSSQQPLSRTPLPTIPGEDWPEFLSGWVWLAGAGPGDPGLVTLHVLNALQQADIVVYDALIDSRILDWVRPGAIIEYAGKRGGKPSPKQRDISIRLIELAQQGMRVLRLKGGDPFVFGRGGEEAQTLVQANIPLRILPGISAGIGGLAYAGIPVTHRDVNQAVTFLTGHDRTGLAPSAVNWQGIADGSQVIVMYMAIKHLPEICENLISAGRQSSEPVAIVSNASLPHMKVLETTLGNAPQDVIDHDITPPAIIAVGEVVRMRQCLDWISQMNGHPPRNTDPLGTRQHEDSA